MSDSQPNPLRDMTRRHFFQSAGLGIGSIALAAMLNEKKARADELNLDALNPMAPKPPHFAAKAKRIIYLFMSGAPSQLDLFEHKPKLVEFNNKECPAELIKGERFAFIKGIPKLLASPYKVEPRGQSGMPISELLPNLHKVADNLTMIKSMKTDHFNHGPAQIFMNTGHQIVGRPSMGAWLTYGLGSECNNLPGYVVLLSGEVDPGAGNAMWGSGFLPTTYQGVPFRPQGDPVLCVSNPAGVDNAARRRSLDTLRAANQTHYADVGDPEIATRIASYEMAYRMQSSVPDLADIAKEPKNIHELYGTQPGKTSFANNCLLARRLIERGVRFVQLFHRGWDHHGDSSAHDLMSGLPKMCRETDQASAALITDLKQRGLLEDTLVVWGGEFGRTPMNEGRGGPNNKYLGRDHHPRAFTYWMAGGGMKPGTIYGETDELGYNIVKNPVHVHDLHATILHAMGVEHTKLTFRFQGRDYRLTDVFGNVVKDVLA